MLCHEKLLSKMRKRIAIIQGHPDNTSPHYCHAIENAYRHGAIANGHIVQAIDAASLTMPFLSNSSDFNSRDIDISILNIQGLIYWSDHIVIIYPLWLGTMPALLKHFFEQIFRPYHAYVKTKNRKRPIKLLKGKSVRIIVTMGMPAWVYRFFYHAHSLKSLEQNILRFLGFGPIRHTLIGNIDSSKNEKRTQWLNKLKYLGESCQ